MNLPIDRLAAAIFAAEKEPYSRIMAMFSAFFDASGNPKDHPVVVVSGYVANYLQWQRFEEEWRDVHLKFMVELPFHMSEFNSACTNQAYKHQKTARVDYVEIAKNQQASETFIKRLSQLQMSFVHIGVSCIVKTEIYDEINSLLNLKEILPPFALGARMCIQKIRNWEREYSIAERTECVFEQGDFGQGLFTRLMIDEGEDVPIYKRKGDFAALQATDHYAWEQFNFLRRKHLGTESEARKPFHFLLHSIPKLHTSPTLDFLVRLCEKKDIKPRDGVIK